jgi:pilus assembly protein CpaB
MIKGMTLPKGSNRLPLILGLVLGLVAFVLVLVVLSGSEDKTSTIKDSGEGVPVVVAASDIAANTRISAEMLVVKNVPQGDLLSGAFTTTEGVVGQVTRVALIPGEQVIQAKVINDKTLIGLGSTAPLALLLDPGQRAVSVGISSLIGAGGNIRPGDFVDVILIVEVKPPNSDPNAQGGTSDQYSATIVQNVEVLAVDTERASVDPAASTDPDKATDANEAATTVTFAVSAGQGEVLTMADVCGQIHGGRLALALRSIGDTNRISNRTEWPADGPPPVCSTVLGIASFGE